MKIEIEIDEITEAMLRERLPNSDNNGLNIYLNAIVNQGVDEWLNAVLLEGFTLLQSNGLSYTGDRLQDFNLIYPYVKEKRKSAISNTILNTI